MPKIKAEIEFEIDRSAKGAQEILEELMDLVETTFDFVKIKKVKFLGSTLSDAELEEMRFHDDGGKVWSD